MQPGLNVSEVSNGARSDADNQGEDVAIQYPDDRDNRSRVGALQHARIGALEEAHVCGVQRPSSALRDGLLADRVGVVRHSAALLAFPTQRTLQLPLILKYCFCRTHRKRFF